MPKVYLSSTFSDLKEYRQVAYHALREMRYDVIAMEDYVATDQRPLKKCLADVAECDLYIGLFAWRYGYIPLEENPEHKSITELEYCQATQLGKPCLIFLLAEDAPWPPTLMDAVTGEGNQGQCITALRSELAQEKIVSFFKTPDHLASLVAPAIHLWENSQVSSAISTSSIRSDMKLLETVEREARLRAMIADHSGFLRDRLESFVGRQVELVEIQKLITEKLETGGYVTITGQAGQGKSCMIAKLVEAFGAENIAFHFIPFNPGPDHQVGLLRNLMARLILKYGLSDLYVASENRAVLRDYFPNVLREVVDKGGQEVIFIDGLDQLEEDFTGVRDLSFLPNNPPPGIVFVLGTRPNDTLKPIELLKPRDEYQLPGLGRQDFDLILQHRQVHLEKDLADQMYQVMQRNALYLDLLAKELFERKATSFKEVVTHLVSNPNNIFSLSMARLKRFPVEWREVIKPVLGLLLTAREPLSLQQIRHILRIEDDRLREGILRLGGLLAEIGQRRYTLFHLKLRDYLRQDELDTQKDYIFATDEEEFWHARLAAWCEQGGLPLIWENVKDTKEQARREYARRHYIAHLYYAREWQRLFDSLDEGFYGQVKEHYDLSTGSYAQDLDFGRQAAAWEGWTFEEGLAHLPNLWRYTLLRCSLNSRADQYPLHVFQLLLVLNRELKALKLAELLTDRSKKVQVLNCIALYLAIVKQEAESIELFWRAYQEAHTIEKSYDRAKALEALVTAIVEAGQWEQAKQIVRSIQNNYHRAKAVRVLVVALAQAQQWEQAEQLARSIQNNSSRAEALAALGIMLAQTQQWERAKKLCIEAEQLAHFINSSLQQVEALKMIVAALVQTQQWERAKKLCIEAEEVANSIEDSIQQAEALKAVAAALTMTQQWQQAEQITSSIKESHQRSRAFGELVTALAQAQQWEQAQQIACPSKNSSQRARALEALVTGLAQAQQWERAEQLARSIVDSTYRAKAFTELVTALTQAQQWERAEQLARSIENSYWRAEALAILGLGLVHIGQWERAKLLCTEAEQLARSIDDNSQHAEALEALVTGLAQAQQWEQAEQFARSIEDKSEQARALEALVTALAQAQQWERAEQLARSIENSSRRARALRILVTALAQAQQWEQAEQLARSIDDSNHRAKAFSELVAVLAQAQQWEQAEQLARSIKDNSMQVKSLAILGLGLVHVGQWERAKLLYTEAEQLTRSIDDSNHRAKAFSELVAVLAQAQQWEQAEQLARSIKKDHQRAGALRTLAAGLAQAQQWEQAEQLARSIEDKSEQARALEALVTALAQAQQWEQAEQLARSIENSSRRARALEALVTGLAQAQQWEQAEQLACSIEDKSQRVSPFNELLTALAQAQQWERAEQLTRSIRNSAQRAEALRILVAGLAQAQQWEQAEQLARSIKDNSQRGYALQHIAEALTINGEYDKLYSLVKHSWLQTETRSYAFQVLSLVQGLISLKPEIGAAFCETFSWVDVFLKKVK